MLRAGKKAVILAPQKLTAYQVVASLGLLPNLKLCLDAGDLASYVSGQSWLDRSGGGYDFFLGADGSATATDPTFNGVPGRRSSGEYFSLDGGDYFTYDSASETWMDALHKDNAAFTLATWVNVTGDSDLVGSNGNTLTNSGIRLQDITSQGKIFFRVANATGVTALDITTGVLGTANSVWQFIVWSMDEATPGGHIRVNLTTTNLSSAYTAPSALAATFPLQLGADGNAGGKMAAGSAMALFMAWSVSLSLAQTNSIFQATRGRFGV